MTSSNLILEIVQLFKQMEKKDAQKELIEILKKIQKGESWKG
jgi:NADH:ubiquinone oxidoreductase subunit E|tara:strand:+ start:1164 stop:1289 length:126 start_codon:yes stop_codon:yes gene_type:complete